MLLTRSAPMGNVHPRTTAPDEQKISILETMLEVLRTDGELLSQHPQIIWQQVYNTLHPEGGPITDLLEAQLQERYGKPTTPPWLKLYKLERHESAGLV